MVDVWTSDRSNALDFHDAPVSLIIEKRCGICQNDANPFRPILIFLESFSQTQSNSLEKMPHGFYDV